MTWNNTSPALGNNIADDLTDIRENFQHTHDASGNVDGTRKDSLTNTIAFPVNNAGAACLMVGDSGTTVAWFYLNTAPTGWKVSATGGDTVLGIAGGAGDYDVDGGEADAAATWTIDGFSAVSNHTHTGPSHTHSVPRDGWGSSSTSTAGRIMTNSGSANPSATGGTTSGASGTAATGGSGAHTPEVDGSWRPKASVGKLFTLDLA